MLPDIGHCLRQAQADLGVTNVELGRRMEVAPQQVARWRNQSDMRYHLMLQVCDALDTSVDALLAFNEE
jgi:DNA-binding Xre family transcriptional regulator